MPPLQAPHEFLGMHVSYLQMYQYVMGALLQVSICAAKGQYQTVPMDAYVRMYQQYCMELFGSPLCAWEWVMLRCVIGTDIV